MNPKPLTLAVNLGGEGDEAQTLAVEVQVEAPQTGGYSVEDGNMKFHFVVSEVFLGEGDNRVALPGFAPSPSIWTSTRLVLPSISKHRALMG